ncbi:hypothetical protein GCM10025858_01160 [Alicyclobacillus sacchari]|uniref:hypothetical protein n=1 Tax=Alicyclobacillus sacchari TaxID=392010 RepID=UPI0023E9AF66|nr:hypothetical protein [Alicyclobacillus sacchari]GMA55613.1 hypothetical protein GCM10025858_01160 [Alicyclobacillus sacchari]
MDRTRREEVTGQQRRKGNQPRRSKKRWVTFTVACFLYIFVSSSLLIFHGPFSAVRNYVIDTFDETRHGYLLRPLSLFTVSNAAIEAHALAKNGMVSETTPISEIATRNYTNGDGAIHLYTYHGETFTAYIMVVDNPKRIRVAVTKYIGQNGETVQQMVNDVGAVAGINGGAFSDTNQQGTGANPSASPCMTER